MEGNMTTSNKNAHILQLRKSLLEMQTLCSPHALQNADIHTHTHTLIFIWLHQVLVVAHGVSDLHCGMRDLFCGTWEP